MTMRVALSHRLQFTFRRQVRQPTLWLRLRPAPHARAEIEAYSIKVRAAPNWLTWVRDPFENHLGRLDLPEPLRQIGFDVEFIAALRPANPFDFFVESVANDFPFSYPDQLRKELAPYLHLESHGPAFAKWLAALDRKPRYLVEYLTSLNGEVHQRLAAAGAAAPKPVDLEAIVTRGGGSPWELAWVFTQSLRALGLAARFTSGYLLAPAADEGSKSGDKKSGGNKSGGKKSGGKKSGGSDRDRASLHAWSEVFVPGAGWIGLDPSLGVFTAERHVPLASAPDLFRTAPLTGILEREVASSLEEVRLRRLAPVPPVKPLSEAHWRDISAAGRFIDGVLETERIALSSGGEVNFVSASETDADEWTHQALGEDKRRAAAALVNRLKARWAPGGAVHLSQGEHFQGEAAARWRLSCYFRSDGRPLWRNPELLAGCRNAARSMSGSDAESFARSLAVALGLSADWVVAAHEDRLHQLWADPAMCNEAPSREELCDPLQRRRWADLLSAPRGAPAGYVLPLRWDRRRRRWASGRWEFRRAELYLSPGNFPLGFRLPLDSLAKDPNELHELAGEPSPLEEKPPLGDFEGEFGAGQATLLSLGARGSDGNGNGDGDGDGGDAGAAPRTAMCVEVREGALHVFFPPIHDVEHYVALLAAIELTAHQQGAPVVLEGYEPPLDSRLKRFVVAPDSGLVRLSLPVASSWPEQSSLYETAYSEAGAAGLRAESNFLSDSDSARERERDGESKSESGGQIDGETPAEPHGDARQRPNSYTTLTLGGPTPASSPFLCRPQILRSLIAYWQNHPCLSYFFTAAQVGPNGNAPRPDEGRDDALYELGMALERFPRGASPHPWAPDRLLRHLLADAAGNMDRAEIRVDQLYAPERQSRRLGQIAIRSLGMPPSFKLAALQTLLVRGLVAHFGRQPYTRPLTPWGSALHDRFMLPQVLWDDLGAVIRELGESGLPLRQEWFAPILELNFPRLGSVQMGDITLELRRAHEPWPLLAEEVAGGAIARFIDVANERLQVRLRGLTPDRYALACNQAAVPLHAGAIQGDFVGAVRYKVCQPPSTLHPTLPPTDALVFDLIDTWTGRAIGGCTYCPAPPRVWTVGAVAAPAAADRSGRPPAPAQLHPALQAAPVAGRFYSVGSGLRPLEAPAPLEDRRFPYLLDLTRAALH